jgi:hypothetical protein
MRNMRWAALVVACAVFVGCGSEWAPVGPLLHEARNNDLAATQKYQGASELRLTGVVVSTGEKKIDHGAGRTDARWTESAGADADVAYPFVQIRDPERPSPDFVTCYFTEHAPATKLAPGATARVHGFFLEFAASGGHVDAVLNRCSVE